MTDGATPRCVFCGEAVDLAEHLETLNSHQPHIHWMREEMPKVELRMGAKCGLCRADPACADATDMAASDAEIQDRMMGRP